MHQIVSATTLLRGELLEPLSRIGDETAINVITDLLHNLDMANTTLDRNISSILGYFSSLTSNHSATQGQVIARSSPAKSLGEMFETGLPPLIQQCKDIRQRDGMTSDVDIIVDFGKHVECPVNVLGSGS